MADNEQSDESRRRKWLARPSWERKEHPEQLIDLYDVMRPHERERWNEGFTTQSEKEDFLVPISKRWYSFRDIAKERPKSDSPDDTEKTFDALRESTDSIKSGLLELKRRIDEGELVEIDPSKPKPQIPSRRTRKLYRYFRQGLFGLVAIGASVIFERMNAPNWLILVTIIAAIFCIAILPSVERASKGKRRLFWLAVVAYSIFAVFVAVGKSQPAQPPPPVSVTTNTPSPSTANLTRPDADQMVDLYKKYSTAQADQAAKSYIGKWLTISGEVADVTIGEDKGGVTVVIMIRNSLGWSLYAVSAELADQKSRDRAVALNKGETVTVGGKIARVSQLAILLEDCRFE
ncbi:MAG TPA: hypothetical protein VFZ40_11065 [Pyrinomonadaceae bacterium]